MKRKKIIISCLVPLLTVIPIGMKLRAQDSVLHAAASGSGSIEGTEVRLASRLSARVTRVSVERGDSVSAGQIVVELDCGDARAALLEAEARVHAARSAVEGALAQADASARNRGVLLAAAEAARSQVSSLTAQQGASARQAARLERLGSDASESSRDQVRSQAEGLLHQTSSAAAQDRSLRGQVAAAGSMWRAAEAQARAAERNVSAAEAAAERARLLVDECAIRAPRAGVVDDTFVEPGEHAAAGTTLVRIVDLDIVRATFYLPNAELAAARPNGPAIVEADAWPDAKFTASIETVGSSAEFTPRNIQTRTDRDRLVFPVEVRIPNPNHQLRPGMPVHVTLPGTER
jgi:HlyD family secretion protein